MKKKHYNLSHNDYFQKAFQRKEVAESFFKEHLPGDLIKDINWATLSLAPTEFVGKALRNRRSDILYQIELAGRTAFFCIHLEHQRTPQKDMSIRMLYYKVHIWQQYQEQYPTAENLPLIYSLVVYQGKKPWTAPLTVHDYLDIPKSLIAYCSPTDYHLLDLSSLSDDDIKGDILQRLFLLVMQNIDSKHITELLFDKYFPLFKELMKQKRGVEYIEDMLYYLSYKSKHLKQADVIKKLTQNPDHPEIKEVVMTLAEQWKQEGIEKGIEKGKIGIVSRQLTIRFRDEAEPWIKKLGQLSSRELDTVSERILTENSLPNVFDGLL